MQKEEIIMKYVCVLCGYVYDEEAEGVKFADLPDDWTCPLCGAGKEDFELLNSASISSIYKELSCNNYEMRSIYDQYVRVN